MLATNSKTDKYCGPLRALILDWAGTVVDFGSCAPVAAVIEAFRSLEVPVSREQARAPMGKAKREHIRAMLSEQAVASQWESTHGGDIESAIDTVYERFLPIQRQLLADHAKLIPGCVESIDRCRARGMKIGSSTGYTRELMDILMPLVAEQGYEPDAMVCASDMSEGRPAPWMCFENARMLGVYPPQAIVKVDDTLVGIEAGLNAGMWTVGVASSGNLVGLSLQEYSDLDTSEQERLTDAARQQLLQSGAHVVIDSVAELTDAIEQIEDLRRR
ncbi:MAG: phosphonoacetaldehyde hydrolase [Planctomycetota bacterium]